MNAKMHVPFLVSVMLVMFSACKKDVIVPEEEELFRTEVASDAAADDVPETQPAVHTPIVTYVNSNVAGYLESLPARYHLTTKKYPLILFIHGIGELGTGVTRVNCCGLPKHLNTKTFPPEFNVNGQRFSFIVISPQFKTRPSAANVQEVIDYARNKYRIDDTRIYVSGLSMGGGSTWDYSAVYGEKAAAIVPVCGGTKPTVDLAKKVATKNLPIWTISSSGDAVVPIQWAKDWISWIDQYNPAYASQTKVTVWTAEGHNGTWLRAFNPTTKVDGMSIYEWMLLHKRGSASAPPPSSGTPAPTPSGNKPPIANAGDDQVVPLSWNYMPTVYGYKSKDPDGYLPKFHWTKVSGPSSYNIVDPNAVSTKVTNLVAGTYVFRLTVTDNEGASASDDVTITMTGTSADGNQSPIANAGDDQVVPLSWNYMPTVYGYKSKDPDGYLPKFHWTKVSGPASYNIVDPNAVSTKVTNLVAGTYVFRLTVTDNKGASASDEVTITMTGTSGSTGGGTTPSGNQIPIANAGDDQIVPVSWNYMPTVYGYKSKDPDGYLPKFHWTKVSGPDSYHIVNPNAVSTKVTNLVKGVYIFRVTVTDNEGASASDDVTIYMQ